MHAAMRSTVHFLLLTLLVLVSCRKETPRELPYNGVLGASHCGNGVKDGNEEGTDCGGDCPSCVVILPSCLRNTNTVTFSYNTTETQNFTGSTVTTTIEGGQTVINLNTSGKDMRFTFAGTPEPFRKYTVADYPFNLQNDEVYMEWINNSYTYDAYYGSVYYNLIDGQRTLDFCEVYTSTPSIGGYKSVTGNLTFN